MNESQYEIWNTTCVNPECTMSVDPQPTNRCAVSRLVSLTSNLARDTYLCRAKTLINNRNLVRHEAWNTSKPLYRDTPLLAAPLFLAPLLGLFKSGVIAKTVTVAVGYLKSGAIIKVISAVSKVSFSIIASLRLAARRILRWWHGEEHIKQLRLQRKQSGQSRKRNTHFRRTIAVLAWTPLFLIWLVFTASMERTPVWGRWRVILMSTDEEAMMLEEFLRAGCPAGAKLEENKPLDWLAILRPAFNDCGPEGTLQGMQVLDPNMDWRAAWVKNVFMRLQDGIHLLNLADMHGQHHEYVWDIAGAHYVVKPPDLPLTVRPSQAHEHAMEENQERPLLTRYGLLVVDGPVPNAFSIGFGPAKMIGDGENEEAPGVVVVYTGILDGILQGRDCTPTPEPSRLAKMFGIFAGINNASIHSACPTKYETDQLASILAHEIGHLLLSHSLESIAADNAYDLLSGIATDRALTSSQLFSIGLTLFN